MSLADKILSQQSEWGWPRVSHTNISYEDTGDKIIISKKDWKRFNEWLEEQGIDGQILKAESSDA